MAKKNQAAVQLGRRGGKATAMKLTLEQRKEAARQGCTGSLGTAHEVLSLDECWRAQSRDYGRQNRSR
jgi:hypothetical protein